MDLLGHNGKVTSDKKIVFFSHQRYKSGNRDYCIHFSVTYETTTKFLIVFVRLLLGKRGLQCYRPMGNWHQIWIWFEDNFKGFRVQIEIIVAIFEWISKPQLNIVFVRLKVEFDGLPGHEGKVTSDINFVLSPYHRS